jgi:Protein of unknown function (DUF1592)/Protein of unknown function (DUF1588)/Protein of unknown function (DUF1595)/Protein of unknown function (DUF1587)
MYPRRPVFSVATSLAVTLFVIPIFVGTVSCVGSISDPGGSNSGGGGSGPTASGPLLPARIRRLTNAEYDASVQALLGSGQTPSSTFPPDSRQGSFTLNDAQRVDPVLAKQLDVAAQALVTEARGNGKLATLAPCADPAGAAASCATTFITSFGARAYRRPLTRDETAALVSVYHAGADGTSHDEGIDLVTRAMLQSAGFLYVTELGDSSARANAEVTLTPNETAVALSYMLGAGPPDQPLLDDAAAGALASADAREQQARRLLALPGGRDRIVRVVREWFGIDRIADTAKDSTVYPSFAGVKASMEAESRQFVDEVMTHGTGTVGELLGADWTIADAPLAAVYGVSSAGSGRTSLAGVGRRGLLNQGAFLSVYAHASETAPVLRGVAIMRRVACLPLKSPTELNIVVIPPAPDPSKTTRQRFDVHVTDALCRSCHTSIDAFGFSFEGLDGMGKVRATDNNLPVDSTTTVATGHDFDGSYADSNALAAALSTSADVRACAARQIFRASAGRSDDSVAVAEAAFLDTWKTLPADAQGSVIETLIAFVRSDQFVERSAP